MFVFALTNNILQNLAMRDLLPQFMLCLKKRDIDGGIMGTLIVCHCVNYNSMLTTLFIFAPIFLISEYVEIIYTVTIL